MSPNNHNPGIFRKAFKTLKLAPLHFLLLQIPEGLTEFIERVIKEYAEKNVPLAVALFIPCFILSTFSNALTFHSVLVSEQGQKPRFGETFNAVWKKLSLLMLASLVLGVLYAVGIWAYVVPGLYLMAIYLFVPQLILTEESLPLTAYLNRSKKLAKAHIWKTLLIVLCLFLLSLFMEAFDRPLSHWSETVAGDPILSESVVILAKMAFTMLSAALFEVWLAHYFLKIKKLSQNRFRSEAESK